MSGYGPARERELARRLELEARDVVGRVDRLDLDPGVGLAPVGRRHGGIVRLRPCDEDAAAREAVAVRGLGRRVEEAGLSARVGPDADAVGARAADQAVAGRAVLQLDRVVAARAEVERVGERDVVRAGSGDDRRERVAERRPALGRLELVRPDRPAGDGTDARRRDRVRRGEGEDGRGRGDDRGHDAEEPERAHAQPSAGSGSSSFQPYSPSDERRGSGTTS